MSKMNLFCQMFCQPFTATVFSENGKYMVYEAVALQRSWEVSCGWLCHYKNYSYNAVTIV